MPCIFGSVYCRLPSMTIDRRDAATFKPHPRNNNINKKNAKKRNKFSWSLQTRSWCRLRRRHRVAARLRVDAVWLQLQAEGWIENARQRRLRRKTLTYLNCVAITSIPTILTGSGCINGHMVTPSVGGCYCNVALQREMKHPREFSVSIMLKHLFYCIEFRAGNTSTKV